MPQLIIEGKKFSRVINATVEISHGDARETMPIPLIQFVVQLPGDTEVALAEWALAPVGPKRWKTVELQIMDRSMKLNHTWTLHKAYVHLYREIEYTANSGSGADQDNYIEIVIRGTLANSKESYDGKNILDVRGGDAESSAS